MLGERIKLIGDRSLLVFNRVIIKIGGTPLVENIGSIITALGCGACFLFRYPKPGLMLLILHGYFDYLDGAIRRARQSHIDYSQNEPDRHALFDKLSDIAIFLPLIWGGYIGWWLGLATCISLVTVTLIGVYAEKLDLLERSHAIFDRSDRLIAFIVIGIAGFIWYACFTVFAMSLVVILQRSFAIVYSLYSKYGKINKQPN